MRKWYLFSSGVVGLTELTAGAEYEVRIPIGRFTRCRSMINPVEAQALIRKHPVSTALSNHVLEKIDKEASKEKRSRSEYVELHFETLFFNKGELEKGLIQK